MIIIRVSSSYSVEGQAYSMLVVLDNEEFIEVPISEETFEALRDVMNGSNRSTKEGPPSEAKQEEPATDWLAVLKNRVSDTPIQQDSNVSKQLMEKVGFKPPPMVEEEVIEFSAGLVDDEETDDPGEYHLAGEDSSGVESI